MQVVNLDVVSYLCQTSTMALVMGGEGEKGNYLQHCLKCKRYFTPMVYSANGNTGTEAIVAQRCLAFLLSNKLKQEYSEMCGFVRAKMSLVIMRFNTLLL